ncbi:Na-translocating system protein MpsC family protein [Paenibacillus soyae]|uniref:Na-translocating system protein MpsC family protein n=1 Tax=Paenibacillus soyae TaxID=2969249 RepID=UPI0027D45194|nr:Na-translocating system protein MpsC family protein [Paenibacillus soyae]
MELDRKAEIELASHAGRVLRESLGKGPQFIHVSIRRPFVVFYMRGLLSPTEKILLEQDQVFSVQHTRDLLMKTLIPELKAYTSLIAGMNLQEFYYDWGLHNQSAVFVGIESDDGRYESLSGETFTGKQALEQEIAHISQLVQKAPEGIYSCMLNERTLLVVRNGILISIEKELIRLGYEGNLKIAKRNLEKQHLHNNGHFESMLKARVIDAYADWDFQLDKSVIVFILNPKP